MKPSPHRFIKKYTCFLGQKIVHSAWMRPFRILKTFFHYGLDDFFDEDPRLIVLKKGIGFFARFRGIQHQIGSREQRLAHALERLGPVFVKFGQVLSTRRDLLPPVLADELSRLQDNVRPFAWSEVEKILKRVYKRPYQEVFLEFSEQPINSASIAQVHFATLHDGQEVAVKVLRPDNVKTIDADLKMLDFAANIIERLWQDGKRLKLREVIAEFNKYLHDELDLMREAANASQLRRNFAQSTKLIVPEMHWDYCDTEIIVMERMKGASIKDLEQLHNMNVNIKQLAVDGVEIFFTQVFRDGFFHADMHPGNILVNDKGQYVALDFGIVGTLTDQDKSFLAQNFLAFFQRDYKRVATAHVEAGWVPKETRVDEFESAIRAVCEPIFDKPLKDISFGRVLLRLFQTSRRFNVEIQPQLVLLQKTLLNIEGLGRQLDPDLDLWKTGKPYLERWMNEQIGWKSFVRTLRVEAPYWGTTLPQLPRLLHDIAHYKHEQALEKRAHQLERQKREKQQNYLLWFLIILVTCLIVIELFKR